MTKLPLAKSIYRFNHWIRTLTTHKEKQESVDEDSKGLIRAKRNINHIPDGWTDTRWIKKIKSWKHQYKQDKQYSPHIKPVDEELQEEEELLFMLKKKYKNTWYYFSYEKPDSKKDMNSILYSLYNTVFNNHWYAPAERLIKKKKLEAQYFNYPCDINNLSKKTKKNTKFIVAIKLKAK